MSIRVRSFAFIAGVALVACSPDQTTNPTAGRFHAGGANAEVSAVANAPILYQQTSDIMDQTASPIPVGTTIFGDDFVVPVGQVWTVKSLVLSGHLSKASLPFSIRADNGGHPATVVVSATQAPAAEDGESCCAGVSDYRFDLPAVQVLNPGTYWVIAEASTPGPSQTFAWRATSTTTGSIPQFSGTLDPTTWVSIGASVTGFTFAVLGTSQATQTITFDPSTPSTATTGTSTTINATASSGLSVSLTAGPSTVCTLSGTTLSFIGAGTCTVTANQAGDATHFAAPQTTRDINVQIAQMITFPAVTPNPAPVGGTAALTASASSGLPISYTSLTGTVCTVAGNVVSFVANGPCTVAADQAGNATYAAAARKTQSVDVVTLSQTIHFTSTAPAPAYANAHYTVGVTGGASGNPVVVTVGPSSVCTVSGSVVTFTGVGTCTIAANQAGGAGYDPAAQVTQSVKVDYHFEGFADPIKNGALNSTKAGKTIPLKWRLTDASGAPVTNLGNVVVTATELSCSIGTSVDLAAESAAGNSGLQNLGDGYYQFNWKVPSTYAKSCKTLQLALGEGSGPRTAQFEFTK